MNERIQELAEQAGLYVDLPSGTPWPRAMSAEECEAAYKKFAELIVLECSSICYKGLENGDEAASLLMNTFGVEE
jgi:hypothetical protein